MSTELGAALAAGYDFDAPAVTFGAGMEGDSTHPTAQIRVPLSMMNRHGLVVAALEDRPRALAEAARRLADRDINIHALVPMGVRDARRIIGFVVDIPAAARDALGDLAVADADL